MLYSSAVAYDGVASEAGMKPGHSSFRLMYTCEPHRLSKYVKLNCSHLQSGMFFCPVRNLVPHIKRRYG
jgi:hypothetical protein